MKKKAQWAMYVIMVSIIIFIAAMALSEPLVDVVTDARNATNLNCSSNTLTTAQRATCMSVDMALFYFLGACVAASIAFITGKKTFSGVISAIFVFVIVIVLISPLKDFITYFRDANHLNCAATTLVGAKMTCLVVDLWLFYFFIAAIAVGATYVFMKKVYPEIEQ